jgi:hypothetical protein
MLLSPVPATTDPVGVYTIPSGVEGSGLSFYGSSYPTLEAYRTTTATFNFYSTQKLVPQQITYAYWSDGDLTRKTPKLSPATFEPTETTTFLAYCEKWSMKLIATP